ncbi:nucleotidase [Enterobacter cloacae]|nr:nucleotidase [Enterobacter cloacae]
MKWDWIFFDADETLFTFDSFGGLQRMEPSPRYSFSISVLTCGLNG